VNLDPVREPRTEQPGAAGAARNASPQGPARTSVSLRLVFWAKVAAVAGFPLWVGVAFALDIYGHRPRPTGSFDAIVVAGCRVLQNGQPSVSLTRRATRAVELWQRGLAPLIVFTGGVGQSPPAEAAAAAGVARQLGVPDSAMLLEDRSTSTLENASFARELTTAQRIIVVTDTYHVRRCEWLFGRYFKGVQGVGVVSPFGYRVRGALREALAFAYYVVLSHWTLPDVGVR
jgi:uncharacterized SAM-binding protein YcdF (DUF218 family)